jgi:hypothetical protein
MFIFQLAATIFFLILTNRGSRSRMRRMGFEER